MAELDALIGSRISLISQQDFRYDGVLFSINAVESSIVLQNGGWNFRLGHALARVYVFEVPADVVSFST